MIAPLLLALAAAPIDAGVVLCGDKPCETFSNSKLAFARALATNPTIIGLGEYHEIEGGPKARSTLKRFTVDLLPSLKGRATSLVAETWMVRGKCGQVEKQATKAVEKTTKRPKETEDELTTMLYRASDLGITNHILLIDCDDYRTMLDEHNELDAEKTLTLVRRKVLEKAEEAKEKGEGGLPGKALVLYGGAIHNDVEPLPEYVNFSFGPALSAQNSYVEIDLIVPEFARNDSDLKATKWWAPALAKASKGKVVLVKTAPTAFMLVFPPTKK